MLQQLTKDVKNLTTDIAKFISKESKNFDRNKVEIKGLNDLVSYVDKEAEQQIVKVLQQLLPEAKFITEENPDFKQKTKADFHWIIDPLDGTTNFLHGLPIFSISIGLMKGNEMVLGVVHEVNKDECFSAYKNGGAFCNGEKINVSTTKKMSNALLATGFPYRDFDKVPYYLDIIKEFMQHTHGLRRMGSAAVDLAYTACGRFEGFFEYNLNCWDVAAGTLLITEAGGKVTDFSNGNDFIFGKELMASCDIHHEMLAVIQKYWKK
ncbi:MAG: inositol monophosphatase [Bacteroidetes bacterium]|nr:MAG: inositol monophosphatase [Bacteroidota bacterium]TAG88125.1 MAG: inositol monophosphatase [Bacteroidota bacterium]